MSTANKWPNIRNFSEVLHGADRNRTQEPVDVRRAAAVDVEPEPQATELDEEAWAIHTVVTAVRPLSGEAQQRVLQYIGLRFPAHKFQE
jgi:hypothetical protein